MTILVTGSTGTIGRLVVERLIDAEADVRALVRDPAKARFTEAVELATGDLSDPDTTRAALEGVRTLFLLNPVVPDELTQALLTLDLAQQAGIERVVYFSVFNGSLFVDVPHFTAKRLAEEAIDRAGIAATILRPAYFFQNDVMQKQAILEGGVYAMAIGSIGLAMVDARDIADVAAQELLRRDRADAPLPRSVVEIVGPDTLTGDDMARIWSDVAGREIGYAGDDLDAAEQAMRRSASAWQARDMRAMLRAFHRFGMVPRGATRETLAGLLGRPPRRYADFARETMAAWRDATA